MEKFKKVNAENFLIFRNFSASKTRFFKKVEPDPSTLGLLEEKKECSVFFS